MLFNGATPPHRSDFHLNPRPEFFYQIEGEMFCRLLENGIFKDIVVKEGEMFYIPPKVPHLNQRKNGSIGLVIHQNPSPDEIEGIVWYCNSCGHELHGFEYQRKKEDLRNILKHQIRKFLANEQLRTCQECGDVFPATQGYL